MRQAARTKLAGTGLTFIRWSRAESHEDGCIISLSSRAFCNRRERKESRERSGGRERERERGPPLFARAGIRWAHLELRPQGEERRRGRRARRRRTRDDNLAIERNGFLRLHWLLLPFVQFLIVGADNKVHPKLRTVVNFDHFFFF